MGKRKWQYLLVDEIAINKFQPYKNGTHMQFLRLAQYGHLITIFTFVV